MAQVAKDVKAQIDDTLAYLTREWRALPRVAEEWREWTPYQRLDFVLEWPLREERLDQLKEYDRRGQLTPTQRARYARLRRLMADNHALLEELLAD